jgi:cAMP phosphodiesterase
MYGHMNPEYLVSELTTLAEEVVKVYRGGQPARKKQKLDANSDADHRDALSGLTVYIIHCKEDFTQQWGRPIHLVITEQVAALVEARQLGAKILAAEQGMSISEYRLHHKSHIFSLSLGI